MEYKIKQEIDMPTTISITDFHGNDTWYMDKETLLQAIKLIDAVAPICVDEEEEEEEEEPSLLGQLAASPCPSCGMVCITPRKDSPEMFCIQCGYNPQPPPPPRVIYYCPKCNTEGVIDPAGQSCLCMSCGNIWGLNVPARETVDG